MKKLLVSTIFLFVTLLSATLVSAGACNNASVKGRYIATYQQGEYTGFGTFTFSGTTDTSGYGTVSYSGFQNGYLELQNMVQGTAGLYIFNSSCNLSITGLDYKPFPADPFTFPVVLQGVASQIYSAPNTAATATTPIIYGTNIPSEITGYMKGAWIQTFPNGSSPITHRLASYILLKRQYK